METARLTAQNRAGLISTSGCRRRVWTREREKHGSSHLFLPLFCWFPIWDRKSRNEPERRHEHLLYLVAGSSQSRRPRALSSLFCPLGNMVQGIYSSLGEASQGWSKRWKMFAAGLPQLVFRIERKRRFYFIHILQRVLCLAFVTRTYIWTTDCKDPIHPLL